MTYDVSIIIVNWNTRDMLRDCLRSIGEQTNRDHEVIVVDNASGDGSSRMVEETFPKARLIKNDRNLGFAAANNQGIAIATGRNILLLNPDTLVLDGASDTMVAWLDDRPDVGCVGCQVMESETAIQRTCFSDQNPLCILLTESGLHRLMPGWHFLSRPEYAWWDRRTEMDVDVVSGMFMLVPRRVIDRIGVLDEAFFVYSEEADWCRRIRQAGYRCVFAPVARILHRDGGGKSTSQIKANMYVQMQKSKLIYNRKHYGLVGLAAVKTTLLLAMMARGLLFGTIALFSRSERSIALTRLAWVATRYHLLGAAPKP